MLSTSSWAGTVPLRTTAARAAKAAKCLYLMSTTIAPITKMKSPRETTSSRRTTGWSMGAEPLNPFQSSRSFPRTRSPELL